MTKGGIIIDNDYAAPTCLGAKKAIDEFLSNNKCESRRIGPGEILIIKA